MKTTGDRIAHAVKLALKRHPQFNKSTLASEIKVSRPVLYSWIAGDVESPNAASAAKLAELAGLSPHWVLTGKGPEKQTAELSPDEQTLVERFRKLSDEGKAHALGYRHSCEQTRLRATQTGVSSFSQSCSRCTKVAPNTGQTR